MKVNQAGNSSVQSTETSAAKRTGKANANGAGKAAEKNPAAATSSESVNAKISTKGKEMVRAKAIATQTPDVREDKIAELKKRIAEGKYHVDSDAVADRLVDDHMQMGLD